MSNHREFTRVRSHIPVDAVCADGIVTGTTGDLSLNGAFAKLDRDLPVGTACLVSLHLDGRGGALLVRANAVVARSSADGVAFRFDELLELESYEHLRNFIHWHAADPDQADFEFDSHLGLRRIDPSAPQPPG